MDKAIREQVALMHAQFCQALAEPTRILILYALNESPHSVNELADVIGLTQPSISRHLKVLRERGLVCAQRNGQSVIYTLGDERIIQAMEILRGILVEQIENQANLTHLQHQPLIVFDTTLS
jgi:DNA-binding transcriptional ArsR family regulator